MKRLLIPISFCVLGAAGANPSGPTVANGNALITNPSAGVLQIVNTPGTIINWQRFSIGSGETTRFVQSGAASAVLNRDIGGARSDILGRLESNGRVFLVNPNGILFGGSSVVDVAGLIASTRDISNVNFAAGNYRFDGPSLGSITVQAGATITTASYSPSGGQVWLIAPRVTQEAGSTITAPQGQVVLAAGSQVVVGESGLGQMTFSVSTAGGETVDSLGTIAADRGAVGLFADIVNHRGTINAPNASVYLHGGTRVEIPPTGTINADGTGGRLTVRSNDIRIYPAGNVHAVGGTTNLEQYQPSQFTAGQEREIIFAGDINVPFLVYRRPDGNFGLRYLDGNSYDTFDLVIDASGALVSPPVPATSGVAAHVSGAVYPAEPYSSTFRLGRGVALPTSEGTRADIFQAPGTFAAFRLLSASGGVIASRPESQNRGFVSFAPLADGTVALLESNSSVFEVHRFRTNGDLVASSYVNGPSIPTIFQLIYASPQGGFTLVGRPRIFRSQLNDYDSVTGSFSAKHWSKVTAAYNPGSAPLVGEAGIAATFATRPGAIPGSVPAAAPPPPPPAPNPGGSSFGGVSGCNASVCSDEVRAARALTSAVIAAGSLGSGPINHEMAAATVAKLEHAARLIQRPESEAPAAAPSQPASPPSAAPETPPAPAAEPSPAPQAPAPVAEPSPAPQAPAPASAPPAAPAPAALPAPGGPREGAGVLISDGGQLERLQQDALVALESQPQNAAEIIAHYQAAAKAWAEKETLQQQLGLEPGNPNDMTLLNALSHMTKEEQGSYFQAIANQMLQGE